MQKGFRVVLQDLQTISNLELKCRYMYFTKNHPSLTARVVFLMTFNHYKTLFSNRNAKHFRTRIIMIKLKIA